MEYDTESINKIKPSYLKDIEHHYDLYTKTKVNYLEIKIGNKIFKDFYLSFAKFKSRLGPLYTDSYWISFMRILSKYRFRCAVSPLPFNEKSLFGNIDIKDIKKELKHCKDVFPEFETHAFNLLDTVSQLTKSNENTFQLEINKLIKDYYKKKCALVLKSQVSFEIVSNIYSENKYLEILTETKFKNTKEIYDLVIFLGHDTWYDHYVFSTIKSPNVINICYDFIGGKKVESLTFSHPIWDRNITVINKKESALVENKDIIYDSPEELSNEIYLHYIQNNLDKNYTGSSEEQVKARLTDLAGGFIVFLRNHEGIDTTQDVLIFGNSPKIQKEEVKNIAPGDYVLLRTGGDKDLIYEEANKLLGKNYIQYRDKQKDWKEKLKLYVNEHTEDITIKKLETMGASINPSKFRGWLNEKRIKPRNDDEFKKLLSLLGIEEKNLEKYISDMKFINAKHIEAGTVVRKKILELILEADLSDLEDKGLQEFIIPDTTASITVFRVLRISKEDKLQWLSHTDSPINIMDLEND